MGGLKMARDIDFALMIQVLYGKGISLAELARKTDIAVSTLSCVKQETKRPSAGWQEAINLLDYWLKMTGETPPRVGDHITIGGGE
jgi:transcriptional regulator with XRE-family HTH domain